MHCPFWEGKSGDVRALWLERQIFAGLSSGASDHLTANSGRALALALCCCCLWDWLCLQPSVPTVGLWCCTQVQLRWLWHPAGQDTSAEKPKKEVCWEELRCFVFCWWLKESGKDRRTAQDTGFHTYFPLGKDKVKRNHDPCGGECRGDGAKLQCDFPPAGCHGLLSLSKPSKSML